MLVRVSLAVLALSSCTASGSDLLFDLQARAISSDKCQAVHWGFADDCYSSWTTHANRLIPVYTYGTKGAGTGIDLTSYTGENSIYRQAGALKRLYGASVEDTINPEAEYMDQTNVFDLQRAALESGRKYIFLVVFDGMDWQTTRAASIWNLQRVAYDEGRGVGTHFQDYDAHGASQFGWAVTSPYCDAASVDVNHQQVRRLSSLNGGYCARIAGGYPWSVPDDPQYLVAAPTKSLVQHAYTDSSSSATSLCCGIKTYNNAVGVDARGRARPSIAHQAQALGYRIGLCTSVPISHATPASAYAHNVHRDDYQDLTRDLLGLPSVSHPDAPLAGVDVLIGAGIGVQLSEDEEQGENFVPGNRFLTAEDRDKADLRNGGRYVVSARTPGANGGEALMKAAEKARSEGARLFGYYGVWEGSKYNQGHLPYATANGDYRPAPGIDRVKIEYTEADVEENPTLAQMTEASLHVLSADQAPFWLMVEAGDVDWANHSNNIDASVGAVNSGDAAVRVITDWVEAHSNWDESLLIVTADHGHYLMIDQPELLIDSSEEPEAAQTPRELAPAGATP